MIKIDLGKEEVRASKNRAQKGGKVLLPKNLTGGKEVAVDIIAILLFLAAVVIALLPQPFVKQYFLTVEAQYEEDVRRLNSEVEAVKKKIDELKPYQTELENYDQQKKVVSDRINAVQRLLDSRGTPVNVLDIVGQSLPARAWLEKIDFVLTGERPTLKMSGLAYSNEEISDYMDALSESVYLADVQLDDVVTSKLAADAIDIVRFEITATPKLQLQ